MRHQILIAVLLMSALAITNSPLRAVMLPVANPSFESPVFADGSYSNPDLASQGGYGWTFDVYFGAVDGGVANPTAALYTGAGGNGTPVGAEGSQMGYAFRQAVAARQQLAGADGVPGNGDDPLLSAHSTYTLTVSVGQRSTGEFGALALQLLARSSEFQPFTVVAENVITADMAPAPGTFADRQLIVNTATVNPLLFGQSMTIRIMQVGGAVDVADYDNVRLEATTVGDYTRNGAVDAADYVLWRKSVGQTGAGLAADGNGDLVVNHDDYVVWRSNFRGTATSGASLAMVPEPATWVALIIGTIACWSPRSACFERNRTPNN